MKPSLALTTAAAALSLGLAGCGQTGPLYMPKPPAKPAAAATAPPAQAGTNSSSPAPTQQ
ncbi:MAG TPA: lipoprotein [Telluria sp.]|nr:lipoprotein [Telluria sp.]